MSVLAVPGSFPVNLPRIAGRRALLLAGVAAAALVACGTDAVPRAASTPSTLFNIEFTFVGDVRDTLCPEIFAFPVMAAPATTAAP